MHAMVRQSGGGRVMRTAALAASVAALAIVARPAGAQVGCPRSSKFSHGDCDGGVHSMTILGMPVSPRAVALGEAMSVIDRDPSTIWYNAAGISGLTTNAFTV